MDMKVKAIPDAKRANLYQAIWRKVKTQLFDEDPRISARALRLKDRVETLLMPIWGRLDHLPRTPDGLWAYTEADLNLPTEESLYPSASDSTWVD